MLTISLDSLALILKIWVMIMVHPVLAALTWKMDSLYFFFILLNIQKYFTYIHQKWQESGETAPQPFSLMN